MRKLIPRRYARKINVLTRYREIILIFHKHPFIQVKIYIKTQSYID